MMKLSFLLVNYNMRGLVEQCVNSIDSQLADLSISYEILIADNSTQSEFAFADDDAKAFKFVRILPIENKGWADALNCLFKDAKGDLYCVCHPDIKFEDGCIKKLLEFFDQNSSVGVISPNMTFPDGSVNKFRLRFPTLKNELNRLINIITYMLFKKKAVKDEPIWERADDVEVDMVLSVCMLIRREVIDSVGAVPSSFFMYYVNDYICLQSKLLGFRNYYVRDAGIIHFERHADRDLYSADKKLDYKRSLLPITDKMERDKMVFFKALYNRPSYFLFQIL